MKRTRVRQWRAALLLAVFTSGCHRWRPELMRVDQALAEEPKRIQVAIDDGEMVQLYRPHVVGDSLIGVTRSGQPSTRRAIALADVQIVYLRKLDMGATATALVLAGAGVAVVYTIVKAIRGDACDFCVVPDTTE